MGSTTALFEAATPPSADAPARPGGLPNANATADGCIREEPRRPGSEAALVVIATGEYDPRVALDFVETRRCSRSMHRDQQPDRRNLSGSRLRGPAKGDPSVCSIIWMTCSALRRSVPNGADFERMRVKLQLDAYVSASMEAITLRPPERRRDGGLLAHRELDGALGLTPMGPSAFAEGRCGKHPAFDPNQCWRGGHLPLRLA